MRFRNVVFVALLATFPFLVSCGEDNPTAPTSVRKITVLYPNGGETFVVGSLVGIRWEAVGISNVDLVVKRLQSSSSSSIRIASDVPAKSGSFVWEIYTGNWNRAAYSLVVRESRLDSSGISDESDGAFYLVLE